MFSSESGYSKNSLFGWLWFFLLDVSILSNYLCQVIFKTLDICVSFI